METPTRALEVDISFVYSFSFPLLFIFIKKFVVVLTKHEYNLCVLSLLFCLAMPAACRSSQTMDPTCNTAETTLALNPLHHQGTPICEYL